jgi:endogenous inhibitor of DNA gyrase (YacG/DUF329 family)
MKSSIKAYQAMKPKLVQPAKEQSQPLSAPGISAVDGHAQPRPCPICGKPAIVEARPFCSKRCADIDLHRWLGGTYAIPVEDKNIDRNDPDDEA